MNMKAKLIKEVLSILEENYADQKITVSEFSQIVKNYFFFGVINI